MFIKDFKGNHPRYIYYLIENLKLNDWKSGSGVPTLNRNHLHPLEIKAHIDLKEQKQIAKVLSDLRCQNRSQQQNQCSVRGTCKNHLRLLVCPV